MKTQRNTRVWLMGARGTRGSGLESGQSIILIALIMVGLIGMTGLAIDGGGLFLLRRDSQNAVDAAVMAASYALCTDGDYDLAAREAAELNGYVDGVDERIVEVNSPPVSGPAAGKTNYVEVIVTAVKPKYFIQIVYGGDLVVTTRGVGYCWDPYKVFRDKAIFAGSDTCQNAASVSGSHVEIQGGVHSNTDVKLQGSDHLVIGDVTAAGQVEGNNVTYDPSANNPTSGVDPITEIPLIYDIADFAPGGSIANSIPASDYHSYSGDQTFHGVELSGLYYVDGEVTLNQATVGENGVTIVATGEIKMSNNIQNQMFKSYLPNHLLFFTTVVATNCGSNVGIEVSGSENTFDGLFYAPFANVNLSGSEHLVIGAIIANTASPSASDTTIIYKDYLPPDPPVIVFAE